MDERQTLAELQLFQPMFRLVKREGDHRSKILDKNVNYVIGRGENFDSIYQNMFT